MRIHNPVRASKLGYILTSLLLCIAGLLLMLLPDASATAICYVAGSLLILCGGIKLIGYFSKDLYRLAFQFDLAFGLFSLAMGLVMVVMPRSVLSLMHFAIGVLVLVDGLCKVQTALEAKRFGIAQWGLIAAVAVLSSAFGLLLMVNPFSGMRVLMVMIGASLLLEGLLNLCVAVYALKILKQAQSH